MVVWPIAGIALCGAGLATLHVAWQRKQRSWPLVSVGWALVIGSLLAWSRTSGVDKGPALGIVAAIGMALAVILVAALRAPVKQRRAARIPPAVADGAPAPGQQRVLAQTVTVLVIVLAGLIVPVAACTASFLGNRALGMEHTANLTLAMFGFPLVWAALATYIGYARSLRSRALTLTGILVISMAIILMTVKAI